MSDCRLVMFVALASLEIAASAPARAETQTIEATSKAGPRLWEGAVGVRTAFIKGAAFDPFSNDDAFAQFSLSAGRVIVRDDRLAFVAGVMLDIGATDAIARDAPAKLNLTRISALAEGRYQPRSRLFGFVRVAPGVLHGAASLTEASSPGGSALTTSFNSLALDASAGAAFRFGTIGDSKLSAWLVGDGGYGWAQSERLLLAPGLGADQSKAGTLDLGSLTPGGGFFRVALALVY